MVNAAEVVHCYRTLGSPKIIEVKDSYPQGDFSGWINKKIWVYGVSCETPLNACIQLSGEETNQILDQIQDAVSKIPEDFLRAGNYDLQPGSPCLALYHGDNMWYRGRVVGSNGDMIKVYFVDYGNTEEVSKTNIAICPKDLLKSIEGISVCALYGFTGDESQEELDIVKETIVEKDFIGRIESVDHEINGMQRFLLTAFHGTDENVVELKVFVQNELAKRHVTDVVDGIQPAAENDGIQPAAENEIILIQKDEDADIRGNFEQVEKELRLKIVAQAEEIENLRQSCTVKSNELEDARLQIEKWKTEVKHKDQELAASYNTQLLKNEEDISLKEEMARNFEEHLKTNDQRWRVKFENAQKIYDDSKEENRKQMQKSSQQLTVEVELRKEAERKCEMLVLEQDEFKNLLQQQQQKCAKLSEQLLIEAELREDAERKCEMLVLEQDELKKLLQQQQQTEPTVSVSDNSTSTDLSTPPSVPVILSPRPKSLLEYQQPSHDHLLLEKNRLISQLTKSIDAITSSFQNENESLRQDIRKKNEEIIRLRDE